MLPSLIRLFGASEAPVYLVPRNQAEVNVAEQATDYVNYCFWNDNPGFLILYGIFKDALTVKTGFVTWWTDDVVERRRKTFVDITQEQIQLILSEEPSARVVYQGKPIRTATPNPTPSMPAAPAPPQGPDPGQGSPGPAGQMPLQGAPGPSSGPMGPSPPPGPPMAAGAPPMPPQSPTYDRVIIEYEVSKPLTKVSAVPPEEMRLDRYARSFKESRVVGWERIVPVDQLIAKGYDRDLCLDNIQSAESTYSTEPQLRNPGRFMGTRIGDGCKFGEWYVKIDKDGDGQPELRRITTIGDDRHIVEDDETNRIRFAHFGCDPISHTIVGDSLADYTQDIQRIKTNTARAILDSAAESINPKTVVNELVVTVDDALNDDLGAVIRTRGDVNSAVAFTNTPFLGQQALPVLEYLDSVLQRRTGLSDAAKGLDPKALQSSTMLGVEAVINGAQERIELVARVLCETGFKDLFTGLYNEICENQNQQRTLRVHGKFVPYDTSAFDASMQVEINANLGKGSDMVRMLALNQIKQDQLLVFQTFGPANPMVGIPEMLNTMTDMLALANIKNVGRYFKTPTPQELQAITSAPQQPNPMAVAAQAALEKVRTESAKAVGQQSLDRMKQQQEMDFKHQELHSRTVIDLQKLALEGRKFGVDQQTKLGALAGQLMKAQSDSDQADQKSQVDMANAQNDAQQQGFDQQQAQNDQEMQAAQMASQHMQAMHKLASDHEQAMTGLAAAHHAAMTGHAVNTGKAVVGALAADADRESAERTAGANRASQEMMARQRPRGKAK